jgi:hypothetical protein
MEQRLTIVTLGVSDLKKSTAFYTNVFGWEKLPSSNDDITLIRLNGVLLSLYDREKLAEDAAVDPQGQGFKGCTLAYNTHSKEEVDQLIADMESKGVHIVKRPQEVFWGGYSSYIADPDYHLWEIAFNPFLQLDETGSVS